MGVVTSGKKRAAQRQYIRCPFESDEFAKWYAAQPVDPAKKWTDPVSAFRRQRK